MTRRHIPATLLAIALAGCSGAPPRYGSGAVAGEPLQVELLHPLPVPAGEASVRLQYGRVIPRNGAQETDPYCILEVERVSDGHQVVQPGSLRIIRVSRRSVSHSGMPILRSSLSMPGFGDDGQPSQVYYATEFTLHSDRQPDVRSLTCQHDQGASGISQPRHLTLPEMQAALAGHIHIGSPGTWHPAGQ